MTRQTRRDICHPRSPIIKPKNTQSLGRWPGACANISINGGGGRGRRTIVARDFYPKARAELAQKKARRLHWSVNSNLPNSRYALI